MAGMSPEWMTMPRFSAAAGDSEFWLARLAPTGNIVRHLVVPGAGVRAESDPALVKGE